jgi:LPXTG-motif cell wall-anchored protein
MPGPQGVDATSIRASCANPWQLPPNNQPNCIMPTGWTMPVFDVKLRPLPLTGGSGRGALLVGALAALTASLAGVVWRRRRAPGPEPGGGHP